MFVLTRIRDVVDGGWAVGLDGRGNVRVGEADIFCCANEADAILSSAWPTFPESPARNNDE